MEKPTIFFSHSAKDRNVILPIKEKLIKITSGVIQIFMSSDGQSIPFGNNWIHKIEDGLNNAKIMFVFVTPTSIESGWIYFEAGFAYSKGIDVIPVGVGIDIGSIRPPLSLLQGFNITSSESLNNFVTVINKNFDLSFEPTFDEEDFAHLFRDFREMKSDLNFDNIFCSADYSIFASKSKPENCGGRSNILDVLNVIQNYLENNNYIFSANKNKDGTVTGLLVNGLKFRCISANSQMHIRDWEELRVTMSMFSFESSFELLKSLIQYAEIKDGAYLRFVPNTGYRYVTSEETLSAIAYKNSNLLIPDGKSMGTYRFCNENVRFTILDKNKYYNAEPAQYILSIGFRPEDTTSEQMLNCIRNLIDIGIIAKDDASSLHKSARVCHLHGENLPQHRRLSATSPAPLPPKSSAGNPTDRARRY